MLLIKTGLNGRACQVRWPSARARVFVATQYWSLIFLPSYENICKLFGRCVHVYRRCFLIFMTTKSHVRRSWCLRGSRWHQYLHQYLRPSLTLTRYPGKRDQGIRESDALLYYFAARRWEIKNNWKNTQTNFWDYINLFHWSYKEFFFLSFERYGRGWKRSGTPASQAHIQGFFASRADTANRCHVSASRFTQNWNPYILIVVCVQKQYANCIT